MIPYLPSFFFPHSSPLFSPLSFSSLGRSTDNSLLFLLSFLSPSVLFFSSSSPCVSHTSSHFSILPRPLLYPPSSTSLIVLFSLPCIHPLSFLSIPLPFLLKYPLLPSSILSLFPLTPLNSSPLSPSVFLFPRPSPVSLSPFFRVYPTPLLSFRRPFLSPSVSLPLPSFPFLLPSSPSSPSLLYFNISLSPFPLTILHPLYPSLSLSPFLPSSPSLSHLFPSSFFTVSLCLPSSRLSPLCPPRPSPHFDNKSPVNRSTNLHTIYNSSRVCR